MKKVIAITILVVASCYSATVTVECKPSALQKFNGSWSFELYQDGPKGYADPEGKPVSGVQVNDIRLAWIYTGPALGYLFPNSLYIPLSFSQSYSTLRSEDIYDRSYLSDKACKLTISGADKL